MDTEHDYGMTDANLESVWVEAAKVARLIERSKFPLTNEKDVQAAIEIVLSLSNIAFKREYRLTERDIPDFFLRGGIVIEVKMRGQQKMGIYRQLERYAEHPSVSVLILATNIAMGLPEVIDGKPTLMASLGKGWL